MPKSTEMRLKNAAFAGNLDKRGKVKTSRKKHSPYPTGPMVIGFLLFIVVGSGIFSIFKSHLF